MKRPLALAVVTLVVAMQALPALARDFVQDQAGMFSAGTVSALNTRIGSFNAQTGKEIVVQTVPSLGGATLQDAASSAFAQQKVNGVLIFIAREDRRDIIVPDRAGVQAGWFTPDILQSIRGTMESAFRGEDYDAGITSAVDGVLNVYRAHLGSQRVTGSSSQSVPMTATRLPSIGGFHISMFWWIIIVVVGFLILRSVIRAMSAPRYGPGMPPGGAAPGGMPGGYYGGPGYGGYGGGGSFWSGLLGGLGGAWLGNEMFGHRGGGAIGPADAGQSAPADTGGGWGGNGGGWQSDAGQADMGGASGGDWSGGGFGGGGGDSGGGGDFGGGGGGDSGGGW